MKIDICSDLHLESGEIYSSSGFFKNPEGDLLLLAGDSCESKHLNHFRDFFSLVDEKWAKAFIINGNHEHYGSNFNKSIQDMQTFFNGTANIKFMHNEAVELNSEWLLIGSTLWTDFCRNKPTALMEAKAMMNDYNYIRTEEYGYIKLTPLFVLREHRRALQAIKDIIDQHPQHKIILMVHHGVSFLSQDNRYNNSLLDCAYMSDLSEFILDRPNIKLIVHGHTHHELDYMIGDCRVICHPRGYASENFGKDYSFLTLEL